MWSVTTATPALLRAICALTLGGCADARSESAAQVACLAAGCEAPTDPSAFACQDVTDVSERGGPNVLAELADPIARLVLRGGDGCPTDFAELMQKLRVEDDRGCEGGGAAGLSTRLVTETGQLAGGRMLQGFRAVLSRRCDERQEFELLVSLSGIGPDGELPRDAELVAFNPQAKEFDYYELADGRWTYFGSSSDFVRQGPGQGDIRRCASCHSGGGLVMKELDTPWLGWTGHFQTPGTERVIAANAADLGSESSGANLEALVNAGNREWTKTRVTHAQGPERSRSVAALLRPLFCTVEHGLDNAADFAGAPFTGIPVDFLVDPVFESFGSVGIAPDVYAAARKAAGFRVPGLAADDTLFAFAFVERSKADIMHTEELERRGIVDHDFVADVLAIDFTRPVFSRARCGLLEFAPSFEQLATDTGREVTSAQLRGGFMANLAQARPPAGSAAAELLAHLADTEDAAAHAARVDAFIAACEARDERAMMDDAFAIHTWQRDTAYELPVMEHQPSMATTMLQVSGSIHLDPITCKAVD